MCVIVKANSSPDEHAKINTTVKNLELRQVLKRESNNNQYQSLENCTPHDELCGSIPDTDL